MPLDEVYSQPWGNSPAPSSKDSILIERPRWLTAEIQALLANGTVADLITEKGRFMREFFTPAEFDGSLTMPMPECPGFDALAGTCNACQGGHRFSQCPRCHGSFSQLEQLEPKVESNGQPKSDPLGSIILALAKLTEEVANLKGKS